MSIQLNGIYFVWTTKPLEFDQIAPETPPGRPAIIASKASYHNESNSWKKRTCFFDSYDPSTNEGNLWVFSSLTRPEANPHRFVPCNLLRQPTTCIKVGSAKSDVYIQLAYLVRVRVHFGGQYNNNLPLEPAQTETTELLPPAMIDAEERSKLVRLHQEFWRGVRYNDNGDRIFPDTFPDDELDDGGEGDGGLAITT